MGTVLVTGATRGIGAATARALATHHELVLVGRDRSALESVARECTLIHPAATVRTVIADLTSTDDINRISTSVPVLDGVVHCAGIGELGRIDESDSSQWRRAFELNVLAVVDLTRVLLPALRSSAGHVVVVNSGAGTTAKPGWGAYSASKFALRAVTDTLRGEEPTLRVTSVHPGRVDTDMQRQIVAAEGGTYNPSAYLHPDSVAAAIQQAIDSSADAHPTEIVLRPRPH